MEIRGHDVMVGGRTFADVSLMTFRLRQERQWDREREKDRSHAILTLNLMLWLCFYIQHRRYWNIILYTLYNSLEKSISCLMMHKNCANWLSLLYVRCVPCVRCTVHTWSRFRFALFLSVSSIACEHVCEYVCIRSPAYRSYTKASMRV